MQTFEYKNRQIFIKEKTMSCEKKVPFTQADIDKITQEHPTPFYIYDEQAIRDNARRLKKAFEWAPMFRNYFAVKATPNPAILEILKDEGFGADCSSLPELLMAQKVGLPGDYIMFTSNDTPADEYKKAREIDAIINLDDISHINFLEKVAGLPEIVCFRYNPGPLRKGNVLIGNPEEAKYGFTRDQLFEGYKMLQEKGVKRFGLHTMIASNELNADYFIETAKMIFELAVELKDKLGIALEFVNFGGGIGIPYKPEQTAVDLEYVGKGIEAKYNEYIIPNGLDPIRIYMECGRVILGPYGYLVTKVLHEKNTYKHYAGLDACMANLMRPALYGSYHHITVMGKENQPCDEKYDVTGSLCENNDKFAIDRMLPKLDIGDTLVIHDAGAHGYAMGFNYNGKLRSAEFLMTPNHEFKMIRRAETIEDYFATLNF